MWGATRTLAFDGSGGDSVSVPDKVAASLSGLSRLTVLAWIRAVANGVVLGMNLAPSDPKVQLAVAGGRPSLVLKPAAGEAALALNDLAGPTLLDDDWHLISFSVDVENRMVWQQQDGAGLDGGATYDTSTPAWTVSTFDATREISEQNIGTAGDTTSPFEGAIARVQLLPYLLSPAEHHARWRRAARGFA
jgi:hypothetical protein